MEGEKGGNQRGKWEPKEGSEGKRGVGERRDRKSREWKMKDNRVGYGGGRKDRLQEEAARGRRRGALSAGWPRLGVE